MQQWSPSIMRVQLLKVSHLLFDWVCCAQDSMRRQCREMLKLYMLARS